jgi:hypothetical protein
MKKVKDKNIQGMIKGMVIFPCLGPAYPESWETMIVDMHYYIETIPFD